MQIKQNPQNKQQPKNKMDCSQGMISEANS